MFQFQLLCRLLTWNMCGTCMNHEDQSSSLTGSLSLFNLENLAKSWLSSSLYIQIHRRKYIKINQEKKSFSQEQNYFNHLPCPRNYADPFWLSKELARAQLKAKMFSQITPASNYFYNSYLGCTQFQIKKGKNKEYLKYRGHRRGTNPLIVHTLDIGKNFTHLDT